jgi:hypothetical protein
VRVAIPHNRSGTPVRGLTASDFSVREDGRPQPIAFFDASSGAAQAGSRHDPVAGPTLSANNYV